MKRRDSLKMCGTKGSRCDKIREIFPTKISVVVFILYMVLFINQGILVTLSKRPDNHYDYNPTTVVMLTECLKLFISSMVYLKDHPAKQLIGDIVFNKKVLLLYFVPAFLYCLYNNLAFVNLAAFDPTTYFILLQIRVVITALVFQVLFQKSLSGKQWLSLLLLTSGCIIKQLHWPDHNHVSGSSPVQAPSAYSSFFTFNLALLLVQVFCSCFAGVYNEYLLKDTGASINLMIQNVFMYVDSIICNLVLLLWHGDVATIFSGPSLKSLVHPLVIAIMINNALGGIVTSIFLKSFNSIVKTFASALELLFTAVLCWMIFGISVNFFTAASIAVVSIATYLYSQNPVINRGKLEDRTTEKKSGSLEDV